MKKGSQGFNPSTSSLPRPIDVQITLLLRILRLNSEEFAGKFLKLGRRERGERRERGGREDDRHGGSVIPLLLPHVPLDVNGGRARVLQVQGASTSVANAIQALRVSKGIMIYESREGESARAYSLPHLCEVWCGIADPEMLGVSRDGGGGRQRVERDARCNGGEVCRLTDARTPEPVEVLVDGRVLAPRDIHKTKADGGDKEGRQDTLVEGSNKAMTEEKPEEDRGRADTGVVHTRSGALLLLASSSMCKVCAQALNNTGIMVDKAITADPGEGGLDSSTPARATCAVVDIEMTPTAFAAIADMSLVCMIVTWVFGKSLQR
ncbi:hypothetical protein B0H14DRAFT_2581067 [Mycena olivaceomarginata]|nr:hypothetical protein B0H14DRAFT_2581067 [Mycena olivaceomarginata]